MSQTYFSDRHHLQSQEGDPLLQRIKSIHLSYSQMDHRPIPSQFKSVLWLGSNAQTLSKAEICGHTPARMKKALAQSLSKSLLIFETCQSPMFTCYLHNSSLALNAATLSADLNTVVLLPQSDR